MHINQSINAFISGQAHITKQRKRETRETDRGTDIKRYSSYRPDYISITESWSRPNL